MPTPELPYQRVDTQKLEDRSTEAKETAQGAGGDALTVRWVMLPLVVVICVLQSILSIYNTNVLHTIITSTLIPVIAFAVLFLAVLCVNPMLRLIRPVSVLKSLVIFAIASAIFGVVTWLDGHGKVIPDYGPAATTIEVLYLGLFLPSIVFRVVRFRPFNRPELVCLFSAMMVTSGISTFGLTEQLIPLVTAPYNPEWNTPQRGWNDKLIPNLNSSLYITDPETIRTFREGVSKDADKKPIIAPSESAEMNIKSAYYWQVFRAIPWSSWSTPLFWWLVFVLGVYALFYSLSYVLLGYWSDREKLIFPLAKLPEALMPDPEKPRQWIPQTFRTGGFWVGFVLAFGIIAWNCLIMANLLASVRPINLGINGYSMNQLVAGTPMEGGVISATPFMIIFTAIGIAFFLPLEISFSAWFYFVLGLVGMEIAVWMGMGQNQRDFPTDWLWSNNFLSGQGSGGLMTFSLICLYRCLRDYVKLIPGKPWLERLKILSPVIGLLTSIVVVALWLSWSNHQMGLLWAFVFVFVCTLVTVGLMRIVAEGGVYWFQSHSSFFHIYKMSGLGHLLPPVVLGPLLPIYSVLFLDVKTFMAPNLINAAKLQSSSGGSRIRFHLCIVTSILASVAVSLAFAIFLAHLRGAQQMHSWFYSGGPTMVMDIAASATVAPPSVDYPMMGWYAVGAIWVALSFYLRTTLFWFPHPIGYIMLINPLMNQLWFSFFIAWVLKKLTVKYGGKSTFEQLRVFFIGLIMGELISIAFWGVLSMLTAIHATHDLNRY